MNKYLTPADNDSDFGPTVPGQRSGEGSGSILPYLAKSLKVNANAGSISLAHEMRAAAKRNTTSTAQAEPGTTPPTKPVKPGR